LTNVEIGMMVAFILALGFSGWKLYAFMPKEQLKDDDTTVGSIEELKNMMYDVIGSGELDEEAICAKMREHPKFDHEHFWRFNLNRLKQLLNSHYIDYPEHQSTQHIHTHLNAKKDQA